MAQIPFPIVSKDIGPCLETQKCFLLILQHAAAEVDGKFFLMPSLAFGAGSFAKLIFLGDFLGGVSGDLGKFMGGLVADFLGLFAGEEASESDWYRGRLARCPLPLSSFSDAVNVLFPD